MNLRSAFLRRYEFKERIDAWWTRYSASAFLAALLIISVVGFTRLERYYDQLASTIRRLERTEAGVRAGDVAVANEREERILANVAQQTALARHEAETAKRIADGQLRVIRQANLDGCERENQLRRRLRASVAAQITMTQSLGINALSRLSTVREYIEVMNRQEQALVRLQNELDQVDCALAYPATQ